LTDKIEDLKPKEQKYAEKLQYQKYQDMFDGMIESEMNDHYDKILTSDK